MATFERIADLPLDDRRLRAGSARAPDQPGVRARHHHLPPARRRRGGARRGRHLQPRGPARPAGARARPAAGRHWTFDAFSEHVGGLDLFPGGRAGHARLPLLPPLGDRERRARPRAAPGRPARWRRRSGASESPIHFVVSLRLGEPAELRPGRPPARGLPVAAASSSTRTPDWDQDADRPARGHRRGRLDRLQGRLQGHARRRRHRPGASTAASPRRCRTPGSRTPT